MSENALSDFKSGQRVQSHPATDAWMRGLRFGTVAKVGTRYVHVDMDGGRRLRFRPENLTPA